MGILQQGSAPLGITPHILFELQGGIARSRRPEEEKSHVDGFLRSVITFPFEPEAARAAANLDARLEADGERVNLVDLFIGCTAVHHGEPVVSRDRRDFGRIPELEVLEY